VPGANLEIDRISKRYGDVPACQELSFAVGQGEVFGLVGGPGAGKTTVLRAALGLVAPDSGEIRLPEGARVGYLPQRRGFDERMTVLGHLVHLAQLRGMAPNQAHTAAERQLGRLGLRPRRDTRLRALDAQDRQTVHLGAALVGEPTVLLLDEPFTDLRPAAVTALGDLLVEQAAAGVVVLLCCRELEAAQRFCDRIGILHGGQLIACGTVAQLSGDARVELVVTAPDAPADWTETVAGVEVLDVHNGRWRLLLADGVDDQALLDAARATGPVHEFQRHAPTLPRLYGHLLDAGREGAGR
jgi:ABC-2 type transport system ATP-binding protein